MILSKKKKVEKYSVIAIYGEKNKKQRNKR